MADYRQRTARSLLLFYHISHGKATVFRPEEGKILLFLRLFRRFAPIYAVNAPTMWLMRSSNTSNTSKRTAKSSLPAFIRK